MKRELRFIDSHRFMKASLESLVSNLSKTPEAFSTVRNFYANKNTFNLLMRKGVHPYEYMDSIEKLSQTELPPKSAFWSTLTGEMISDSDYEHARSVWNCKQLCVKTLRDYTSLYNRLDVLQLCDVFENFRDVCKKNYDLDPAWYYSAPGLAWDALLKVTDIKLQLLTDPDMLLMFERGIRGGISTISNRYARANNIYMGEEYLKGETDRYITYLDANNLYGWAMSRAMPTHGFKWMTDKELADWKTTATAGGGGCILEVDLEYPTALHDLHND